MKLRLLAAVLLLLTGYAHAQDLKPGFDKKEFLDVMKVSSRQGDSAIKGDATPAPDDFDMVYRSPVRGLENRFDLWVKKNGKLAVIVIRGTVGKAESWMENVYAGMQPAIGKIGINDTTEFEYKLAEYRNAAVHSGWLIGLASMAADMESQIKKLHEKGVKDFIIAGHSQGGAIGYLVSSHIYYRTKSGNLPKDITYKTYCSAAPKPGNQYYSYDYDYVRGNGWGITVQNAADWVPETPFSIQQVTDFNKVNPFVNIKSALRKQPFLVRLYAGSVYNKMSRSTRKAHKRYLKYLGHMVGKFAKKTLPALQMNEFAQTSNYAHAGTTVMLMPDEEYFKKFPDDTSGPYGIFPHHMFNNYYFLVERQFE